MTRSRSRKLRRNQAVKRNPSMRRGVSVTVASVLLASMSAARADDEVAGLQEVVVTAQKRSENLQDVPISVQALGTQKLEELNVLSFNDYVKYLPSVSYQTGGEGQGPGFARIYMRGVASGGDGNHSASLPSVGVYLDEQPVTTIQGPLDIHVYDIARVEALAGPQGTLFGASSEAGTIRIITNKPDPSGFKAGYDIEGNVMDKGGPGGVVEGFANLPISSIAAVRLVGWLEHDGGYINNVPGTLTYPKPSGFTLDNSRIANKHYNSVDTEGGRVALKVDLDDSWSITPAVMGQHTRSGGIFAFDPAKGDLNVSHFYPEGADDHWIQSSLTIEGKISNFDIVYAGALLQRHDSTQSDYTDYSLAYNASYSYIQDAAGNPLANPSQRILGRDHYKMTSHELRVTSPKEYRVRGTVGVFTQHQQHDIEQRYVIDGLGPQISIPGWPDTWWLTSEKRINRDYAAFFEGNLDILSNLTLTGGVRFFKAKNSLEGFYGFNDPAFSGTGVGKCFPGVAPVNGGPCENINKEIDETGHTPKVSLQYKFDRDVMVYATWAKGFRPGGVNRVGSLPPYKADFLTSYEIGWKTTWLDNRVRFNGAFFWEDWKDFQFSFLAPGSNSVTQIANAGQARIKGVETDVQWAATTGLTLTAGAALMDPKLTQNYCGALNADGSPVTECANPQAPKGQQLPTTPKFKGNVTARYIFPVFGLDAHVQGAFVYQSSIWSDLRTLERGILGKQSAYGVADFSAGVEKNGITAEFFIDNAFDRRGDVYNYAECTEATCGPIRVYHTPNRPRMFGLRFGQRF
jgi:iron complex outermembrane receptor protein